MAYPPINFRAGFVQGPCQQGVFTSSE